MSGILKEAFRAKLEKNPDVIALGRNWYKQCYKWSVWEMSEIEWIGLKNKLINL